MKKSILSTLIGIIIGGSLFGGGYVIAANVTATPTTSPVFVDGKQVSVDAYNINGSNYFKLRDFCAAVDIGVWYDDKTKSIYIERDKKYDVNYTGGTNISPGTSPRPEPESESKPEPAPVGNIGTVIFDDLEITFKNTSTWSKVNNQFSDKNGKDVFQIPITIKNLKNETHGLSSFRYTQYGPNGLKLDNVGYYFGGDVVSAGDMRSGATQETFMTFLYDGDGEYVVEFSKFMGSTTEIKFSIKK